MAALHQLTNKKESLVKGKSNFYPPRTRNKELETHIRFIYKLDIANKKSSKKSNFSAKEWTELRNLMNQPVLSKNHYRAMNFEHLNNQIIYQKLDKNLDSTFMKIYKKNNHKNIFVDKEFKYLNETDYNTSNFYGLPKIHKSRLITNAIKEQNSKVVNIKELKDLKARPIVGGPRCSIRKLSELRLY